MKKKLPWPIRILAAGCIAFLLLNLFAWIYRGGLPAVADETRAAPLHYVPNGYFSNMREGIAFGFFDENGFNNLSPVADRIDYLLLGSSQVEAKQVMQKQTMVSRLNELLSAAGGGYAYSIGVSGEAFYTCVNRLPYALRTYHPGKAVVLETSRLDFTQAEIDEALAEPEVGDLVYSADGGILGFIRKLPYLRLAFVQLRSILTQTDADAADDMGLSTDVTQDRDAYSRRIGPMLDKVAADAGDLPVVILYLPSYTLDRDGTMHLSDVQPVEQFCALCEEKGNSCLDMGPRFYAEYERAHVLPSGFVNSSVGTGHLNRFGHAMTADELFRLLTEVS